MKTNSGTRAIAVFSCSVALIACSSNSGSEEGISPQKQDSDAVTLDSLLSAPVPELCRHDPGFLANGRLPLQDPSTGAVMISPASIEEPSSYKVAFGDLTGDGVDDGALVTICSAGGVAWPQTVQLYTAGPTRLGGVDLGDLTHGREIVTAISIADGRLHVTWMTNGPDDGACCPTVAMAADLRWDGQRVVTENMNRTN